MIVKENNKLNVLIVEDNYGDYELLIESLNRTVLLIGNILHAVRISEVITLIQENPIDLVLLDLTLPDSTGISSVITLNKLLKKTPIVVLSGSSAIEIAMEAISHGAQDFLVKGEYDEKLLSKTLQYSLERKKILENLEESYQRYEFVNKATMDTILEYDLKSHLGKWGEGIIKVFGYSKDEILFYKSFWDKVIHPDDYENVSKNILSDFEKKAENWQDEFRFKTASGDYKDVFGRGFILYDQGIPYKMFAALTDITQRKRLEEELLNQKLDRQKLITEITIEAQEKERTELGKELHDNINQMLATVKLYLGMAISNKDAREDLLPMSYKYVDHTIEEIRKLSKTLVTPSLGETDLKSALEGLLKEVEYMNTLKVDLVFNIEEDQDIEDKKKLTIYRIVQEQLNNIHKHANADKVKITLKSDENNLSLSVSDNGKGFDVQTKAKGIGLKNIISRVEFYAGSVNVISAPGAGCTIEALIPR